MKNIYQVCFSEIITQLGIQETSDSFKYQSIHLTAVPFLRKLCVEQNCIDANSCIVLTYFVGHRCTSAWMYLMLISISH